MTILRDIVGVLLAMLFSAVIFVGTLALVFGLCNSDAQEIIAGGGLAAAGVGALFLVMEAL